MARKFRNYFFALTASLLAAVAVTAQAAAEPVVIGWVETVDIPELGMKIKAKIDTGAKTSTIGVLDFSIAKKSGQDWIKFTAHNNDGKTVEVERPVHRYVTIHRSGTKPAKRPVVLLNACVGNYFKRTQFTVTKRPQMVYRMLIGRRFLRDQFLVASDKTFAVKPNCSGEPEAQDNAK